MNRRGFLKFFGAAAATAAMGVDLAQLLQPARTYFLPPTGGWRGNQLVTIDYITNRALQILNDEMVLASRVAKQYTITNDQMPTRKDVLYGHVTLYKPMSVDEMIRAALASPAMTSAIA